MVHADAKDKKTWMSQREIVKMAHGGESMNKYRVSQSFKKKGELLDGRGYISVKVSQPQRNA